MPRYIDFIQKPKEVQYAAHTIGLDNKRPYQLTEAEVQAAFKAAVEHDC